MGLASDSSQVAQPAQPAQPAPSELPPQSDKASPSRGNLLRHWIVHYSSSIDKALIRALLECGHLENFPYNSHYLHIKLKLKPDSDGNASTAFVVEEGAFRSLEDQNVHPVLRDSLSLDRPTHSCLHTLRRAGDAAYIGYLNILYDMSSEDRADGVWEAKPIYRVSEELERRLRAAWDSRLLLTWVDELRSTVAAGIVYRKELNKDTGMPVYTPGKIVPRNNQWHWVRASPEEVVEAYVRAGIQPPQVRRKSC